MEFRKLIKFGEASYVVSLPKEWTVKNNLKKGDLISIEEDQDSLRLTPNNRGQRKKDPAKEVMIEFEELKPFRSELMYAYINGFSPITVTGKTMNKHWKQIREIVANFAGLEVIQQTPDKIVLKDLLNIQEISIHDIMRRIDRINSSMSEDVAAYLKGEKNTSLTETLHQRETDVDKLTSVIFKTLKRAFEPHDRKALNLRLDDVFYYWELALFLEKIADELKRIPFHIKGGIPKEGVAAFEEAMEQYKNAMQAHFTNDPRLAMKVLGKRVVVYNTIEKCMSKVKLKEIPGLEKFKLINNESGNIAGVLLKLNYKKEK